LKTIDPDERNDQNFEHVGPYSSTYKNFKDEKAQSLFESYGRGEISFEEYQSLLKEKLEPWERPSDGRKEDFYE